MVEESRHARPAIVGREAVISGAAIEVVATAKAHQRVIACAAREVIADPGRAGQQIVRDDAVDGAIEHEAAGDLAVEGQVPGGDHVVLQGEGAFIGGARAEGEDRVGGGVADGERDRGAAKAHHLQHVPVGEIGDHIVAEALVVGAGPDQLGAEAVVACAAGHLVVARAKAASQLVIPVAAVQRVIARLAIERIVEL